MSGSDPEIEQELRRLKADLGMPQPSVPAPNPAAVPPASRPQPHKSATPRPRLSIPWQAKLLFLGGCTTMAVVWVANLPFPFVRQAVQEHFPVLLIPSYISWDYNYRQAVPLVEQAKQLINQPTTFADLDRAKGILNQAKTHVEALPVLFPSHSTRWYWHQLSFDQFRTMRESVGQMEAKLFQERQSQTLLSQAEGQLDQAKTVYQTAQSQAERVAATQQWDQALNQLQQISANTLAGQIARTKLNLYRNEHNRLIPQP